MHQETLAPDNGLPGYHAPIKIVPLAVQVLLLACRDRLIVLSFLGWSGLGPTVRAPHAPLGIDPMTYVLRF